MQVINSKVIIPEAQKNNNITNDIKSDKKSAQSFSEVLSRQVQFTKHANMRINTREVDLSSDQMNRVMDGISEAKAKGINDSLILVDNVALVVSVKNRTVITVMNRDQRNVFTNIDGAVIV